METRAKDFTPKLVGRTIVRVMDVVSDCGLCLELDNGTYLYFGYSGDEGYTTITESVNVRANGEVYFFEF